MPSTPSSALARRRRSWGVEVDDFFDQVDPARLAAVPLRARSDRQVDQGPSRRQPERRRLSALSPADHRRRQVDGNVERRGSRALPSGLLRCVARRAGSGGATGAGARRLNLPEAKCCDVGAVPSFSVCPDRILRRRWSRICTRPMRRRRVVVHGLAGGNHRPRACRRKAKRAIQSARGQRSARQLGSNQSAQLRSVGEKADVRGRHHGDGNARKAVISRLRIESVKSVISGPPAIWLGASIR